MSTWHVALSPNATFQIKDAVFYYNSKSKGLGKRFYQQVANCLKQLDLNPYFQIRYDKIRCLPIKSFPYMIHFEVDEKAQKVFVYAVICTLQNPDDNWVK